jgi:hypothetical protein
MAIPCCQEKLGPILNRLLDCLAASMEACQVPPCRLFLSTDSVVPWDVCCECGDGVGQAWVNVSSIVAMLDDQQRGMSCAPIFEATVKVGILRCALTQDDAGNPPEPIDLTEQALKILRDRALINQAIFSCWSSTIESDDWTIGDWTGLGPQGGCVGGQVTLTVRFNG